jgi:ABC-type polar amino acid transport system ATPase subunit
MASQSARTVLDIRDLRLARGGRDILRGVSLAADRGEIVAVMGLSGSGKTSILRSIAALEEFDGGEIVLDGVTLRARTPPRAARRALHQRVGMVFQFHHLFEHLSALENVCLAPVHVQRLTREEAVARARQLLEHLGVGHRIAALPRELSGGEAQRVAIARALAVDPPVLLLDEPTASLDPARCGDLGRTLQQLSVEGRTLMMTTHDEEFVIQFSTRVVVLADGLVVETGPPKDVLVNPSHPQTRALLERNA